jgi:AraC-like DNA-binding protein
MYERKIITDFGIEDFCLLGKYHYEKAGNCLEPHFHQDMMEIVYCHSGMQLYEVNNQSFQIKGGEIFITFPNELHSTNKKPEEKGIIYWLQIFIHKRKDKLLQFTKDESIFLINKLLNLEQRHFKADAEIHKIIEEMFFINSSMNGIEKKLRIKLLLSRLILLLIDTSSRNISKPKDDKTLVITSFIRDNLTSPMSISALAKVVYLSESRFKSWFKEQFGMPAMEYIHRQKINLAIEMLTQSPERSVTDIAFSLNFSSPQHFSTLFKKYVGKSPVSMKPQIYRKL